MFPGLDFTCVWASCFLMTSMLALEDNLSLELEFDWNQDPTMIEGWGFEEAEPSCHKANSGHQQSLPFYEHCADAILSSPSVKTPGTSNSELFGMSNGNINRSVDHHLSNLSEQPLVHPDDTRRNRDVEEVFEKRKKARFPNVQVLEQLAKVRGNDIFEPHPLLGPQNPREVTHIASTFHPEIPADGSSGEDSFCGLAKNFRTSEYDPEALLHKSVFERVHQTHDDGSATRQVSRAKALSDRSQMVVDKKKVQEEDPNVYKTLGFLSIPERKRFLEQFIPLENQFVIGLKRVCTFHGLRVKNFTSNHTEGPDFEIHAQLLIKTVNFLNEMILQIFDIKQVKGRSTPSLKIVFQWLFTELFITEEGGNANKGLKPEQVNKLKDFIFNSLNRPGLYRDSFSLGEASSPEVYAKEILLITKTGVHILGSFYKSNNLVKFKSIFPYDMDFVKLLLITKFSVLEGHRTLYASSKSDFFSKAPPIPWENEWEPEVLELVKNENPFKHGFSKTTRCLIASLENSINRKENRNEREVSSNLPDLVKFDFAFQEKLSAKQDFGVQEASTYRDQSLNRILDLKVADSRVYAWIGSMSEKLDIHSHPIMLQVKKKILMYTQSFVLPDCDVDLTILEQVFQNILKVKLDFCESKYLKRDTKIQHFITEKECKNHLFERLNLLLRKLYCLNKRFLEILNISSKKLMYRVEQYELFYWLEKKLFNLTKKQFSNNNSEISEDLDGQIIKELILSYYNLEDNYSVMFIKASSRKDSESRNLDKDLESRTEAAFKILTVYHKSTNFPKWRAIFPCDIDSVKVMSLWKLRLNNKFKKNIKFKSNSFFDMLSPIPWKQPWDQQQLALAADMNPLKDCFMKPETIWMREEENQDLF